MNEKVKVKGAGAVVKLVQLPFDTYQDPVKVLEKSDKSEQLNSATSISAADWVPKPFDMQGLALMVQHSTILPQCIRAYKNNIAGFGISVCYTDDIKETDESKKEWDTLKRILDLISIEKDAKEKLYKIV